MTETDTIKNPKVIINPSLDRFNGKVLFPEKMAKLEEAIKNTNMLAIIEKYRQEEEAEACKKTSVIV